MNRPLLIACLAALTSLACEDNETLCYRDQQLAACRSRCQLGEDRACSTVQRLAARAGDRTALEKLCNGGDMFMCKDLAQQTADPAEKRAILERACAQGDIGAPACAYLADLLPDPAEKRPLLERACATPYGLLACRRLADLDPEPASRAHRLAAVCIGGLDEACERLVDLEPAPAKRRDLLLAACANAPFQCEIHPIAWAFDHAALPRDAPARTP